MKLTRKALIIIMTGTPKTDNDISYVIRDAENYYKFLTSDCGGKWDKNEIIIKKNISTSDAVELVESMNADYTFTVFSGHGGISTEDNKLYLEFIDGDLPSSIFRNLSKRQTIIFDTCRTYFTPGLQSINDSLYSSFEKAELRISNARQIFDNYLKMCDEGIIRLYASTENQAADGDEDGSYFSSALINSAKDWARYTSTNNILNLFQVFSLAEKEIESYEFATQKPKIHGGKRLKWFPFAIRNSESRIL